MALDYNQTVNILRQAVNAEIGVGVKVEGNRQSFVNELRRIKEEAAKSEPALDNLCFLQPKDGRVFICKKTVEMP